MKKKENSSAYKLSDRPSNKQKDEDPEKSSLNHPDPDEDTRPPLKEKPITNNPHREEILDGIPD